jgi:hypothetical protein
LRAVGTSIGCGAETFKEFIVKHREPHSFAPFVRQ